MSRWWDALGTLRQSFVVLSLGWVIIIVSVVAGMQHPQAQPQPVPTTVADCAVHINAANSCDLALLSCISVQSRVILSLDAVEKELQRLKTPNDKRH